MDEIKRKYLAGEINKADAATALRDYHECIFIRLGIMDKWDQEIKKNKRTKKGERNELNQRFNQEAAQGQ